ncbi:ribonuclease H [Senna tora]|uniref:Ribonuclease H n=1 Tax=Senna tora TaxID=362788 RepID=A0A834TUB5_9FABA|nr:ribonuclease H [Senna tora]
MKDWNQNTFEDIKQRKNKITRRLHGIHAAIDKKYNPFLEKLGKELNKELEDVLSQEEELWFQKARCTWIRDGDRNTKYYHTKAITRRRENKITMLKNRNGDWTETKEEVKSIIVDFYKELFKEDQPIRDVEAFTPCWPHADQSTWDRLSSPFLEEEVKSAVFSIGGTKAPGSDGFPASFYHQNWSTTSGSILNLVNSIRRSQTIGRYHGAKITHGRQKRSNFRHIFDKVQMRLASWKANSLSLVGRATLAQTVQYEACCYREGKRFGFKTVERNFQGLARVLPECSLGSGCNGLDIDMWLDQWVPNIRKLKEVKMVNDTTGCYSNNLIQFVDNQGQWNYDMLSSLLPNDVIYKINNVNPPNESLGLDLPIWCPEANGKFSTCGAYYSI